MYQIHDQNTKLLLCVVDPSLKYHQQQGNIKNLEQLEYFSLMS